MSLRDAAKALIDTWDEPVGVPRSGEGAAAASLAAFLAIREKVAALRAALAADAARGSCDCGALHLGTCAIFRDAAGLDDTARKALAWAEAAHARGDGVRASALREFAAALQGQASSLRSSPEPLTFLHPASPVSTKSEAAIRDVVTAAASMPSAPAPADAAHGGERARCDHGCDAFQKAHAAAPSPEASLLEKKIRAEFAEVLAKIHGGVYGLDAFRAPSPEASPAPRADEPTPASPSCACGHYQSEHQHYADKCNFCGCEGFASPAPRAPAPNPSGDDR